MSHDRVVVVGASVAGVRVAQALRGRGCDREIALLDAEEGPPYDKPALSKESLTDAADPPLLLTADQANELAIDHRPAHRATGLDLGQRVVHTSAGPVAFGDLVIATGSRPRRLTALDPVADAHYVRTRDDAAGLRKALTEGSRVVVVGGGFIGGEVAAAARRLGLEVEIVEAAPRILARLMPAEVSAALSDLHAGHGVRIRCGRTVVGYDGGDRLDSVVLDDGTSLPADLVVVGIGTLPATDWLDGSGVSLDDGVLCGPDLQAEGALGIWVAGDAARVRDPRSGATARTEHWTGAREQAVVVARNITSGAGEQTVEYRSDGYVWSDQHGVRIQHVGRVGSAVHEEQTPRCGRLFVHSDGDRAVGATGMNAQAEILRIRRSLASH